MSYDIIHIKWHPITHAPYVGLSNTCSCNVMVQKRKDFSLKDFYTGNYKRRSRPCLALTQIQGANVLNIEHSPM